VTPRQRSGGDPGPTDEIKGTLEKVIDSSEKKWEGSGSVSPAKTTAGEEVKLPQESIVIYSSILKL
jgi:hypothetical protein